MTNPCGGRGSCEVQLHVHIPVIDHMTHTQPITNDIINFRGQRRRTVVESVRVSVVTRVRPVRSVPRGSSMILMRKNSLAKVT